MGREAGYVRAIEGDLPFRGSIKAADEVENGCLPGPIGPYQADNLPLLNLCLEIADGP